MLHDPDFRWRNLARYWSTVGRVLDRSPVRRAADLGAGLVRRVRGKILRRQGYLDPHFAAPRSEVFERYSAVQNTTELVTRQADALRRQHVTPPWRLPSSQAELRPAAAGE